MLVSSKSLSLIEQKRLQWAKEREEMVGFYGLWGRPENSDNKERRENLNYNKNNLLPPIQREISSDPKEEQRQSEESETSGYYSDSPKHVNEINLINNSHETMDRDEQLNNEETTQQYWSKVDNPTNYWPEKTIYKNFKNENWAHQNTDLIVRQNNKPSHPNKNCWYGTPDSVSSDDGCRLRWGDRGIGIGHLWEPVVNVPDCRLPQVADPYRQTPKWVEKGLKNADGETADILIIHHPDDAQYNQPQKNFLLGQNAPIPPEVIEEREKKRRKALEHQKAIKKQLEERELKRRLEKENRLREEKLEEERIRKEQEIERLRYEEEQRKIKEKECLERKKEEAMREAIKEAEKQAKEEKRRSKYFSNEVNYKNCSQIDKSEKLEKIMHQGETNNNNNRANTKDFPKSKEKEESESKIMKEQNEKSLKDSSSQFEEIQLANNFQLLNVNGLPIDGGLALMLENTPKDNFLIPPDGVQLALLMSPRNATSTTQILSPSPGSICLTSQERILTPSKYRVAERKHYYPRNKSTQTEFKSSLIKFFESGKTRKQSGSRSSSSMGSQKHTTVDRHNKHIRCFIASKYSCKPGASKITLEDRPKWGINRPSIEYKKQSEKDLYYQRKIKERIKKASGVRVLPTQGSEKAKIARNDIKEKELDSVVRLIDCQINEKEKCEKSKEDIILKNGYRMNSNLSSPVFVPIKSRLISELDEPKNFEVSKKVFPTSMTDKNEVVIKEEVSHTTGSVGFLTQSQLDAIRQITSLREGLKKLQKDYSHSRSTTPFSDISVDK